MHADSLSFFIFPAVAIAVKEIDREAGGAPEPKAFPRHAGKVVHDVAAGKDGENAHDVDGRAAERAAGIWGAMAQDDDADGADEGEDGV